MSKRLEIVRSLLSEKCVIFVQISDIELSQLRLMCDSIFGEENFINVVSVNMKKIAGASGGDVYKRQEQKVSVFDVQSICSLKATELMHSVK